MKRAASLILAVMLLLSVSQAFALPYTIPETVKAESVEDFYGIWHAILYGYGSSLQMTFSAYYQLLADNLGEEVELNGQVIPLSMLDENQYIIGSDNVFVTVWGSFIDGQQNWTFSDGVIREKDSGTGIEATVELLADGKMIQRADVDGVDSYVIFERLDSLGPAKQEQPPEPAVRDTEKTETPAGFSASR